ncbi:ANTAR domain-containing protein [Streptomyces durmitorensis]|uniref:ANTAR domain-containing protein n=1 Tax=Streptomyces durmitorensis TaxID=319947 RepID=A0ABY4Q2V1_9ACTN|nr:ANTAR domain-containing protein [Streptomyces durmitorensis]UQT59398.1 ANTAR domain-containing protein [Streptomyces durmitorensis]
MTHPVMADYLRALSSHTGQGVASLPLEACADMLGLDGLALLLNPVGGPAELVQSYGERTGALEDLQQVQGQGPSLDAARFGTLLLLPDVADDLAFGGRRWPGLPGSIEALNVRAVFSFPLRIGVIALGALTGHRTGPGPMSTDQLTNAFGLADIVSQITIATAAQTELSQNVPLLDEPGLHFAEVHQATGMVAAQLEIGVDQALIRLRGHAFSHDLPLLEVAREVLALRLCLDGNGTPGRPA